MKRITLFIAFSFLFILASCSKKEGDQLSSIASGYFDAQKELLGFGKISIGQISDMAQLKNIPNFGRAINFEIQAINACIDIDNYIYFGVTGTNETDIEAVAFANVRNIDSLNNYLAERGNTIEKKNNLNIAEEDEFVFIYDKELIAIVGSKDVTKEDALQRFQQLKDAKNSSNEYINKALLKETPILLTINPEKAYQLNDNDELKKLMTGDLYKGILQSIDLNFVKGAIEINHEFIGSKDKIAKLNFINGDKAAKNFKTSGKELATIALNIDFSRIEKENKNILDFALNKLEEELDRKGSDTKEGEILALVKRFISKDNPLTSISNGLLYATADLNNDNDEIPSIQFYIGSSNGDFKKYLKDLLLTWDSKANITIKDQAIEGTLNASPAISYGQSADADKNVLKLFVDIEQVAKAPFIGGEIGMFTQPLKSLAIQSKENITKLTISTKDASTNSLEYLVKEYAGMFLGN